MKATATIYTATGTASKEFELTVNPAFIFCPVLVEWALSHKDRVSNYINITANGRTCLYTL